MKSYQNLFFLALIFGISFHNMLLSFDSEQYTMEWVLSDLILSLYLAYLLDTFVRGSIKPKAQCDENKFC